MHKKIGKTQQNYNYGIEVLRIISMFMVVILHVLGQGGILANAPTDSPQYHVAWLLEILCYCAVNCYALISGYVMIEANFKYRKYLLTWLQVFTYSIGITLIFMLWNRQSIGLRFVVESFLPVLSRRWWYFTAYTGVFFLAPFLNAMIKNLDKKKMTILFVTLIALFSLIPTLVSRFWGDLFYTQSGYSMLWLLILYILGAIYKRCEKDMVQRFNNLSQIAIVGWIVCILVTFTFHNGGMYLPDEFPGKQTIVNNIVNYISPTMVGCALCMLVIFSRLRIAGEKWGKYIKGVSKLAFGVYLIHVHPLVWQHIMQGRFASFATMPVWKMVLGIISVATIVFVLCLCIDAIRSKIFDVLNIRKKINKLGEIVSKRFYNLE